MKKILILIVTVLLLGGCYDNIELNNLAIITGLGIDYQDDNFVVTYEILNDTKTEDNTAMLSYTEKGSGKTINEAFTDANFRVGKKPFFAHLKIVVLSESIIKDKLDQIIDYLLRDTNIRDEFIMMVANGTSPDTIFKHNDDNNPVVSDLIFNLITNEIYNDNLAINEPYQKVLAKLVSHKFDVILGSLSIIDDAVSLNNFYIFKGYNVENKLDRRNSTLYSLFNENVYSLDFTKNYGEDVVTISVNSSKKNIDISQDEINITLDLEARIIENSADLDLKKEETYRKLNQEFGKIIQKEVNNFVKILQENKSDVLGFQDLYYKKMRKENKDLWTKAQVNTQINLKINTKGFIFEVEL